MAQRFVELQERIWESPTLQRRLRRTAGQDEFIAELLQVAREAGVEISAADVEQRLAAAHQAWMLRWIEG